MNTNVNWTNEDDEGLIDFVKNHEALYNLKTKEYRNSQMKENLWANIGTSLKKTGFECRKRWMYIRDYYIRRKGKPGTGSSGAAAKKRSDLLSFLDILPASQRNSISNIEESQLSIDGDTLKMLTDNANIENTVMGNSLVEAPEISKKISQKSQFNSNKKNKKFTHSEERLKLLKQIAQRRENVQSELDETDLFFSSIAKIVKKLPRYEQVELRIEISKLVGNAEIRCIPMETGESNESSSRSCFSLDDSSDMILYSPTNELSDNEEVLFITGD